MKLARLIIAVCAVIFAANPASAERIVTSLTTHQVFITSNFLGLDLVLFGTVERTENDPVRNGPYDLVVTVTGPKESIVTRRKQRVLGVWVNVDSRSFIDVPSYLAVMSTRPFDDFAGQEMRRRLQLGLERTVLMQRVGTDFADVVRDDPFRMAFLRLKEQRKLYIENTTGVTVLTPGLFRTTIPLPATVPVGTYDVDIKLFAEGALVARSTSAFEVVKVGFEQFVVNASQSHGVLYGLATVGFALMTGWFASVVFRKD